LTTVRRARRVGEKIYFYWCGGGGRCTEASQKRLRLKFRVDSIFKAEWETWSEGSVERGPLVRKDDLKTLEDLEKEKLLHR